jgi:hypothetical protein
MRPKPMFLENSLHAETKVTTKARLFGMIVTTYRFSPISPEGFCLPEGTATASTLSFVRAEKARQRITPAAE